MGKAIMGFVLVVLMAAGGAARADKVTDSMDKARSAYGNGKLTSASRELQFALGGLRKRLTKAYGSTMPAAPSGWKARKARSRRRAMGPFGAGISAQRSYNQDGGRGRASAQIIVDNPMLQAMAAMFANPTMAANSGYERLSIDGLNQPAFIKYDEDRKRGEVVILLAGRVYLKVSASRIESDDVLKDLANGWNIKKIKEVAEIQ